MTLDRAAALLADVLGEPDALAATPAAAGESRWSAPTFQGLP